MWPVRAATKPATRYALNQPLFQRLECPYCGNQNQAALAYFTDDEGLYRLYVCEQCHTYIKAVDLRRTESQVLLPLERVMTLDMDREGQEKGYKPGQG
ncbi:Protein FdhE [subsurface metagenome]